MNISLPEITQFQLFCSHESGWADSYGALFVAAAYCGIDLPFGVFPHVWHHGCMGPWTRFPRQLSYNLPPSNDKGFFVARKNEEALLKSGGYNTAKAIGLPAVYVPDPGLSRTANTLLVMPQHTLVGMELATAEERRGYVMSLRPFLDTFDVVVACISANCIVNGYFLDDFKELGIEVIPGANASDVNACLRVRCLMEQFDTMTTNGWGSHVAYAFYYGMKVSIFGQRFAINNNELSKDISWSTNTATEQEIILNDYYNGSDALLLPFKQEPPNGKRDRALGAYLVGEENKQEPGALKELFGWV